MIKYNNSNINDWNYGSDNIVKVYRNNAVCYYQIISSGGTPTQVPCYAVVDNISQYSDREFVDVYNKTDEKWYKLNNLNQYEEYGVYGSGRTITYYEGKLTIDDGYEYQYSGGTWNNVGEVSGSTATLPNVPFSVNYNANNYDANTKTLLKTSGQLVDTDAVITAGTPTVHDGYLTIASGTRATISGYQTYFNRTNSNGSRALTIVSKQKTESSNCHMFANRDSNYNWMYRCYSNKLTLHGGSETGSIAVTTQPVIESVRVQDSSPMIVYNNYTNNTTSSTSSFSYGSTNNGKFAMFQGYGTTTGENFVGDFYWVYMSQNTLTDDQIQQVIAYNENSGTVEYPIYYDEKADPPNNLSFSSMTEAEEYECPYVGMEATIDGDKYIFSGDSISGYEWVEKPAPSYLAFVAKESGTFTFTPQNSNVIYYSVNNGSTWTQSSSVSVSAGDKVLWKGTMSPQFNQGIGIFSSSGRFTVEGNAMSLFYGDNFSGQTSLVGKDYAFKNLFSGCTTITSAENMVLPATTLASSCYSDMFRGCTSLTTPPVLSATTLASTCCSDMFNGCTSLTTAPELLATTLAQGCYQNMFRGCISLTSAPSVLPATTLVYGCYTAMFYQCSSLTTAPILPATTLEEYCYSNMFGQCTSLNNITCLATNISATNCTIYWVNGVAYNGTFTKASSMSSWTRGTSGIPNNWSVQDYQG